MEFCTECENKLFPIEEDDKLWNKCLNCGYKGEIHQTIIEKKKYKNNQVLNVDTNRFLIYDNALPRTTHKTCPNDQCLSHKDKKLQEAVFIQDPVTIKLTYVCVCCNTSWKY